MTSRILLPEAICESKMTAAQSCSAVVKALFTYATSSRVMFLNHLTTPLQNALSLVMLVAVPNLLCQTVITPLQKNCILLSSTLRYRCLQLRSIVLLASRKLRGPTLNAASDDGFELAAPYQLYKTYSRAKSVVLSLQSMAITSYSFFHSVSSTINKINAANCALLY